MKEAILLFVVASFFFAVSAAPCCGDGRCDFPMEDCKSCPKDCGLCSKCTTCGNRVCDVAKGESSCNCPSDCGPCCVDGYCREDLNETALNCPQDCAVNLNLVVVDQDTLVPIENAAVRCGTPTVSLGPKASAAKSGAVSFSGVQGDVYTCTGEKVGYTPGSVVATVYPISTPTVWVIKLKQNPACLEGTVYDAITLVRLDLANVYCSNLVTAPTPQFTTSQRITGLSGKYYYEPVPAGDYRCFASRVNYYPNSNDGIVPPGKMGVIDIYLTPLPGGIIGHVWNKNGMVPIPGVTITCNTASGVVRTAVTDSTGFYSIQNVTAGEATCTASLPNFTSQTKIDTVYRSKNTTIDFIIAELPGTLTIFVGEDPTKTIIPGARVECSSNVLALPASFTNVNGTVTFQQVPGGNYTCVGSAAGYITNQIWNVIVTPNKNSYYEILLKVLPNRIIVIVKDSSTDLIIPFAFARVAVTSFPEVGVQADGSATFYPVARGSYTAFGRAEGYVSPNSTAVLGLETDARDKTVTVVIYLKPIPCTLNVKTVLASDLSVLAGVAVSVSGFATLTTQLPTATNTYTISSFPSTGSISGVISGYTAANVETFTCGLNATVSVVLKFIPVPNIIIVTVLDARTLAIIPTAFVTLTPGFTEVGVDATASVTFSPVATGAYTAFGRAAGYSSNSTGPVSVVRNQTVQIYVYLTQLPCILRVLVVTSQNNSLIVPGATLTLNNGQPSRVANAQGFVDYVLPYSNASRVTGSKISYKTNSTDFVCRNGDNTTVIVYLPEVLTIVFAAVDAKSPNNPYINANITFNGELIPAAADDSRFHYKEVDSLPISGIVVATAPGFNDQTDTGIRFTLTRRNYTISLAPQEFTLYFTPVELIKSSTETRGFFESRLDGSGYLPNNYFDLNPTELRTDVAYIPKPIQIGGSTIRNTSPQTSNAYTANVTITFVDFSSVTVLASKFDNVSPPPLDSFTILPSPISGMVANWAAANITGNEVVINVPPFASTAERNLLTNYPYQLASGYIMLRVIARLPDTRTATAFGDNDFVAATITLGRTSQFTNYNSKNIPLGGKVKCFFEFPLAFQSGVTDIQVTAPLQTYNLTLSNFLNPDTGALTTAKSGPAYEAYTKFTFTLGTSIFSQTSTGQQARDPKASLSITRDYALVLLPAKKRSD